MNRTIHILALSLLAIAGCTGVKRSSSADAGNSAEATLRAVEQTYLSTPNLNISGQMNISGVPADIWFDSLIKGKDSLKVTLTLPFGMPGGGLSATPNHFVYFIASEAVAVEGRPDRETFSKLMQISLDYNEMIALMRGEVPSFPKAGNYTVTEQDGYLTYKTTGDISEELVIDPSIHVVKSYIRKRMTTDAAGAEPHQVVELAINYDYFNQVGNRSLARRATVSVMDGQQIIRIKVTRATDKIEPNESLTLTIPAGVQRRQM